MIPSLTIHGSGAFHERLWTQIDRVGAAVENAVGTHLVGLALGGGYGRGEGAVVQDESGHEHPYNDLDFTIIVDKVEPSLAERLQGISRQFTEEIGVDVDFSRPLTLDDVEHLPHWMMWHDLVQGHLMVRGPENLLSNRAPAYLREPLPATEGLRLLLNRGAGLLWSLRLIQSLDPPHDGDFLRRNLQKARLAFGDCLLVIQGRYTTQCKGRDELLRRMASVLPDIITEPFLEQYAQALQFKFCPDMLPRTQPDLGCLREAAQEWVLVFLAFEQIRTGLPFPQADQYANWITPREASLNQWTNWPGNLLRQLRLGNASLLHPREQLYRSLPVLLDEAGRGKELPSWAERSGQFLRVWKRVN